MQRGFQNELRMTCAPNSSRDSRMTVGPSTRPFESLTASKNLENGGKEGRKIYIDAKTQELYIAKIFEFITVRSHESKISKGILKTPASKTFQKVFAILMTVIDPNFPNELGIDESFEVIKKLGYPFAIPKNSAKSVGAPGVWPSYLSILNWLVEIIGSEQNPNSQNDPKENSWNENMSSSQSLVSHTLIDCYLSKNSPKECCSTLSAPFEEEAKEAQRQLEEMSKELEANKEAVQRFKKQEENLETLNRSVSALEKRKEQIEEETKGLLERNKNSRNEITSILDEAKFTSESANRSDRDRSSLIAVVQNQQIDKQEEQRVAMEQSQMEEEVKESMKRKTKLNQQKNELQNGIMSFKKRVNPIPVGIHHRVLLRGNIHH